MQRTAFGGKVEGRNFGVSPTTPARFDVTKLAATLEAVHERLAGVVIERLPFPDLIARYDRPATLFYLDPPYWGNETDYGAGIFARHDFARLAAQLATIKGSFILSLNDRPEVRQTFAAFQIEAVQVGYSIGLTGRGKVGELVISNRPLKPG